MTGSADLLDVPVLPAGCAITIGVFDGVHRGHQELLDRTVLAARRHGVPSVAVTFDPHPLRTLRPGAAPALLLPLDDRVRLLERHGIDRVVVLRFDEELAELSAGCFIERLVVATLHARHVTVGAGFRFGRGGRGGVSLLTDLGRRWRFEVDEVGTVGGAWDASSRFSSTSIRRLVALGRVEEAGHALGRPHRLVGRVTACPGPPDVVSVEPLAGLVRPAPGRYAVRLAAGQLRGPVELGRLLHVDLHRRESTEHLSSDASAVILVEPNWLDQSGLQH